MKKGLFALALGTFTLGIAEFIIEGIDAIRINPGNIGGEENVKAVADMCRSRHIPIRIGVNGGSLEKELRDWAACCLCGSVYRQSGVPAFCL